MAKWLDIPGLTYFWGRLRVIFDTKVDKIEGKGLSSNDFTDEDKAKLDALSDVPIATREIPGIIRIGDGFDIDDTGLLTPKVSQAGDNLLTIKTEEGEEGFYVSPPVLHKLRFGADQVYEYDGSDDVTVPVYLGDFNFS